MDGWMGGCRASSPEMQCRIRFLWEGMGRSRPASPGRVLIRVLLVRDLPTIRVPVVGPTEKHKLPRQSLILDVLPHIREGAQ